MPQSKHINQLFQHASKSYTIFFQSQVTRAEVEEDTFAIKRELAAIKQHDIETSNQLESAKDRIRKLSEIVERSSPSNVEEEVSLRTEIIKQKEEMIQCLQDELIKVRLAEAENDENIRDLNKKVSELEEVKLNTNHTLINSQS